MNKFRENGILKKIKPKSTRFQKLKAKKKRFLFLKIAAAAVFVITVGYSLLFGSHYDMHTGERLGTDTATLQAVYMRTDVDGVVELEDFWLEDDEIIVRLGARGKGHAVVLLYYSAELGERGTVQNVAIPPCSIYVNRFGTVFNTGTGMNFNGHIMMIIMLTLLIFATEIVMVVSFIEYWCKADFCYPMIACGGMAILFAIMSYFIISDYFHRELNSFSSFLEAVESTTMDIFVLLIPVLLLLSLLVIVSNIILIAREGFKPVNALGIGASLLWVLGLAAVVVLSIVSLYRDWNSHFFSFFAIDFTVSVLIYVMGYFECMILSSAFSAVLASKHKPAFDKDYIIILGCAMNDDGTPAPLLRGRIDRALRFEREQFEKTGKHAYFVPSGGKGADEIFSEAECMKRYLMKNGVPEEQILPEDRSVNTMQNMAFSKKVIEAHAGSLDDVNLAFCTTNYHVFRGYILARKNGFYAEGISAKTKHYFYPNAFLREFVGLVFDRKKQHPIFLMLLILGFAALRLVLFYTFMHG